MTVFSMFEEVPFEYLEVDRGGVYGNRAVASKQLSGVFKLRLGMISQADREAEQSSATLHIRPEDVTSPDSLVGNGVRHDGIDYDIVGVTEGRNFDTGEVEHYRLSLERVSNV